MRRVLAIGFLAGLAGAPCAFARPTRFSGRCDFTGAVAFDPALTNLPQPVVQRARAAGTCTGRFVDARGRAHRLAGAPVTYAARSVAEADSCLGGTADGSGVLTFPDGRLGFLLSETRLAAVPLLTLDGGRSGSAMAAVTPNAGQDPVAALRACAGPGLEEFTFDARLQTTPRISG
jgi:hypothetical protein